MAKAARVDPSIHKLGMNGVGVLPSSLEEQLSQVPLEVGPSFLFCSHSLNLSW